MADDAQIAAERPSHRPAAPTRDALIEWPAGFGTRFAIFVDTEEEFDWAAPFRRDGWGTRAMAALPAAHQRFVDRGVAVTYLIDYPVAVDPASIEGLRSMLADGRSAVGAQLHPWVNPPFEEAVTRRNSYAGNLPRQLEAAKLDMLSDAIATAFGAAPIVYRAGRYGIGPHTLELLAERGYRIDTSIRPAYGYAGEGGPDFTAIGNAAFRAGPGGAIVEIPFTTIFTGRLRRRGAALHRTIGAVPFGAGLLSRTGMLQRVSLTPEGIPLTTALESIRVAAGEGVRLLNFAFHSPSVVPGYTPYVRDQKDLAAFWRWWDAVFDLLDRLDIRPAALAELVEASAAPLR